MSITVTNPEGRKVEFKDQRGPTCGLYALSFVLEYLYNMNIPATANGDKTKESLRNRFKKDGKTIVGELYDATAAVAGYINALASPKIKCQSVTCDVSAITKTLNEGGLCMVPFCVDAGGNPSDSGIHAHWCVLQAIPDKTKPDEVTVLHWGDKVRKFSLTALKNSNNAIKNVEEQYWGKIPAASYTFSIPIDGVTYVQCSTATDTSCKRGHLLQFPIKPGSVRQIPATALSQTLAGKMLVFEK